LVVAFSSDRGLCGGFNSNLIKTAKRVVEEKYANKVGRKNITVLPIGKKVDENFRRTDIAVNSDYWDLFYNLNFEESSKIAQFLMNSFLSKEYDVIEVVYSKFKNAAVQEFSVEQFLPVAKVQSTTKASNNADYVFEPNKIALLEELIPKILKTTFFRYCLDNNASEHGARMVAMDSATNNAGDLIKKLEIEYNKARQAAITNQIMEIVGGAAALDA
jgi:F-type H+-transporting ATPase subunit gamma